MSILHLSVTAALLALAGCGAPNSRVVTTWNTSAALTGDIPVDSLQWRIITSGPRGSPKSGHRGSLQNRPTINR